MGTNVTARNGYGAVHRGGYEMVDGTWAPACGIQSAATAARTPAKLRTTEKPVTCKRCGKLQKAESLKEDDFRESLRDSFEGLNLQFN